MLINGPRCVEGALQLAVKSSSAATDVGIITGYCPLGERIFLVLALGGGGAGDGILSGKLVILAKWISSF